MALVVLAGTACGGDSDSDRSPRVLGVTITTSTTTPSTTAPSTTATSTPPAPAPPSAEPTTTTAPPTTAAPPAPTTGAVDVAYEAVREDATITVALETEAGAVVASRDASATGQASFRAVSPGRYRVAVSEVGRPEERGDTATSSAVTTRTELFDVVPGGSVAVSCVGNGDCTIVA